MKFEEVLPALRRGEKVRRASWIPDRTGTPPSGFFDGRDIIVGDDWEVVQRPRTDEELIAVWLDTAASLTASRHYDVAEAYRTCAHELRMRGVVKP